MKKDSPPSCPKGGVKGSIAVLVLWAILFLSVLSVTLSHGVATRLLVASDMKWTPKVRALGTKALADTVVLLKEDESPSFDSLHEPWAHDESRFKEIPYGGGTYSVTYEETSYGLQDEERKINVNRATSTVLSQLFQNEGKLDPASADALAVYVVDWRDQNNTKEGTPTSEEDCSGGSLAARCKNADFEVLEELLWIPGMEPAVFQEIRDDLTLYGTGASNFNTATETSLKALGVSSGGISKILSWRSAAGNAMENVSWITGRSAELGLDADDQSKLQAAVAAGLLGVQSDAYQGSVKAEFGGKVKGQLSFIVDRDGELKSWKE